jgi:ADP-ribose pyrophosphatase YjhB (NUDIX family)
MTIKPNHTSSAGGVILNPDNKILVVNQNGNSWSLPKGHVEHGEDKLTAAKREIHEESGITQLNLIRELGTYERFMIAKDGGEDARELKTITMFLFTTSQTELLPVDPENPEARWVRKDEVVELLTHDKDKEFFRSIMNDL